MNQKLILIAIIVVGVLIAGAVYYGQGQKSPEGTGEEEGEIISSEEAGEKVINFIDQNILRGRATASLIEVLEDNGLYKIKFSIEGQEIESYLTRDGKLFFPEAIDLSEAQPAAVETGLTIGDFAVSDEEVCKENGKPIVYFFGSEGCSHCKWEHPVIEEVAGKFGDQIAFHNNMDTDNDMDVFQKYSTGGIPTLVLGCKYYRIGSGETLGEEEEAKVLTALLCKLTNNQPGDVCSGVQDLINQIEN